MGRVNSKVCPELVGLSGPFTKIARAMSAQWGVRIVPSGSACKTDGQVIYIPFTADLLPADKRQVLHGMLDHEVCHVAEEVRHTKAGRVGVVALMRAETDKKLRFMINVFEDIRIEQRYEAEYPGVAENLRAQNVNATREWSEHYEERIQGNFWHSFGAAIICRARHMEDAWTYKGEIGEWMSLIEEEIAESQLGGEWVDTAIALARRVCDKVKKKREEQEAEKKKSKKKEPKEGKGKGTDEPGDDGDDEEDEGKKPKSGTPDVDPEFEDFADKGREIMSDYVVSDARAHDRYIPHPKAVRFDRVSNASDLGAARYDEVKAEVVGQISGLRSKQRMKIMSWSRRRVVTGLDTGFVDDDSLPEVRLGNRNAFTDMTKRRALNTAITGLVDVSGSMGTNDVSSNCAFFALRTAIALAESWLALNVPNEWLGYTVNDYVDVGITYEDVRGPYFCRPPLNHLVFKGFEESLKKVRGRFMDIQGHGSNVDGEAVSWAARRLAARPEPRKILVVLSDGQPATWNALHENGNLNASVANLEQMQSHLRYVVKSVTSAGIEVIGFGCGTEQPAAFYNASTGAKFVYIRNIATMAVDIFRVMKARIVEGTAA